jgi:hypothetical protein
MRSATGGLTSNSRPNPRQAVYGREALAFGQQAIARGVKDHFLSPVVVREAVFEREQPLLGKRKVGVSSERLLDLPQIFRELTMLAAHDDRRASVDEPRVRLEGWKE